MRAHPSANVMGETLTTYFQTLNDTQDDFFTLVSSEWVAVDRINADTNGNFDSWPEFFGPHAQYGDEFSTVQRYNISDSTFVEAAVGFPNTDFAVFGSSSDPAPDNNPPFAAKDIIIVSLIAVSIFSLHTSSFNTIH